MFRSTTSFARTTDKIIETEHGTYLAQNGNSIEFELEDWNSIMAGTDYMLTKNAPIQISICN